MSKQKTNRKYKNHELRSLYEAFSGLDGVQKDGVFIPFHFSGSELERIITSTTTPVK